MTTLIKKMVTNRDDGEGKTVEQYLEERRDSYELAGRRIDEMNRLMAQRMSQVEAFQTAITTIN